MAKGEAFYGEMRIGADVRPEQKIDVKRIKTARKARNNSVFDENKTFDSNAAIKEAGKRKSKKIRKKKVESEKFEALKQDKVDEPEQAAPKNVTAQELQWWKERRGVIKLKPDDTMGELPEIKKGDDSVQVEAEGNDIESLRKEELELVEKIQRLPKSHPKQPLSEEKKDILDKLEKNRKAQQRIIAEARQIETEPKEAIKTGGHGTDSPEIIKSVTQEELPVRQDKHRSKVFQQQYFDDKYVDNLEARQEMEELAKQPSPETLQEALEKNKEAMKGADEALLTYGEPLIETQKQLIKNQEKEIAELKEGLENAKKVESKLAAMENALKEKIEELTVKDATKLDKFKKFITNPKVKLAIGIGLIGVASVATGGGALVGAWLHLPYGLGISALGGTSNLTTALLGSGLVGRAYGDKIKNGFRENMKEILGIIKNEEKTSIQKSAEDGKNAGSEQRPADEIVAETHPETPAKETEDIKDKTRKDDKIDVIEGSGSEELTLEEKEKMRKIAKGNKIDIISPGAEVKDDGELIKKTERMKKPVPETEDKFNKKAEDVRTFVGQLKEGKKTGKEIVEYLENLRYHFRYLDETNFSSKIKPEIDKLSKEEKTDMIDSAVEYLRSEEKKGRPNQSAALANNLHYIIYGKGFTERNYLIRGKNENVEWLFKKENKK